MLPFLHFRPIDASYCGQPMVQVTGFSHAMTIERLLQDKQEQLGLVGKVLIVDEAAMVSSRQMAELLHLAERNRARVVFSGDTQQIQRR